MLTKIEFSLSILVLFHVVCGVCQAQPELTFPIDCIAGEDCWVVNYVDVDPTPNTIKDFSCGPKSYDNHKGTDIAIRDWKTMHAGVDVLAAAGGKVLRFRDGVADKVLSREELNRIKAENKSCGNGLFIEHADGWQTIYCHLKKNSIVVKANQAVSAGQKLGQVGHSGYVEFPHLHIGVMHNESLIDPYTGLSNQEECNNSNQKQAEKISQSLWSEEAHANYSPVSIYASGFSDAVPKFEQIKQDASSPDSLPVDSPALTFWVSIFGVEKGDQIVMEVRDPEGRIFSEKKSVQKKTRARQFLYIGKKNRNRDLIKGKYTGLLTLIRVLVNGEIIKQTVRKELAVY